MVILKLELYLWMLTLALLAPLALGYIGENMTSETTSTQENGTPSTLVPTSTARPRPSFSVRRSNNTPANPPILLKVDSADPAIHYYLNKPAYNNSNLTTAPLSICELLFPNILNNNCVPFEQIKQNMSQDQTPPISGKTSRPRFSARRPRANTIPTGQAYQNKAFLGLHSVLASLNPLDSIGTVQKYLPVSPLRIPNYSRGIQAKNGAPREKRDLSNHLMLESLPSTPVATDSLVANQQSDLIENEDGINGPTSDVNTQYPKKTEVVTKMPQYSDVSSEVSQYLEFDTDVPKYNMTPIKVTHTNSHHDVTQEESTTLFNETSSINSTADPTTSTMHPSKTSEPETQANTTTTTSSPPTKKNTGDALINIVFIFLGVVVVGHLILMVVSVINHRAADFEKPGPTSYPLLVQHL